MCSTSKQRYFLDDRESRIQKAFKGNVHLLAIALNYEGSDAPLNCTVDADRLTALAHKNKVKDIVKMYDTGATEKFPSIDEVKAELAAFAGRCAPHDYFVLYYSGHGSIQDNEEANTGKDSLLCLRSREGEDQELIDDDLAALIASTFHPDVSVLTIADACCSAGVMDCDTPGIWGSRHVVALSGCQENQCSQDTGDGGAMTNALLKCLKRKAVAELRRKRKASIQYIFNRMVDIMPDEESDEEDEDEESEEEEEGEEIEEEDAEGSEDDEEDDDDEEPGQDINLSWPGGCEPSKIAFPF